MEHKRISNYIFNSQHIIGQGFSSKVYKGRHIDQHQPLAIKVIELKKITNEVQKQLLNNEIHALRIANHPSIIKLHDIYQTNNNIYIIMEMGQTSLAQKIHSNGNLSVKIGPMNENQALMLISKLVEGFIHLQQNGVIHRDVKPNNILLIADIPKIVDFGFCQIMNTNKTKKYYNVGSPKYMSPQAYRKTIYSYKSDMWALGITFLESLLGKLPFDGMQYDEMIRCITMGQCYHQGNLSGLCKMILSRMLSVDVERRFDFNELRNVLRNHLTPNLHLEIQPKTRNSNIIKRVDRVISRDIYDPPKLDKKAQTQPKQNTSNENYYKQQLLAPNTQPFNNITNKYIQIDQKVHHLFNNNTNKYNIVRPNSQPNISKKQIHLKIHQIIKIISILHSDAYVTLNLDKIKLLKLCYYLAINKLKKDMQQHQAQRQAQLSNLQIILSGYKYLQYQEINQVDKYYSYFINNFHELPIQQIYFYIDFWIINSIKLYYSQFENKYTIQDVNKNQQAYSSFLLVVRLYQFHCMLIGEKEQRLQEVEGRINNNWMEQIKKITNNITNQNDIIS